MKKGDKIVCIDDTEEYLNITEGKIYEILKINEKNSMLQYYCLLTNDKGTDFWAHYDNFRPIEEYRNEKINSILI